MGALLSIPFLAVPGITTIGSFAASCCGAAACSALCSACGKCQSSIATRIAYALIFLVNSILSWVMLSKWAISKLEHLTLDALPITCLGEQCWGFVAVHRINFALGVFHAILAVLLLGVRSSKNGRAGIQNGYWGPKIIGWLGLIVLTFLIPEKFFLIYGTYFAMIGAILFLLIGLVLLVDLAHSWAETCLQNILDSDSRLWRGILIGSTLGMYVASLALTIVMYIFFAHSGCSMNQAVITINFLMFIITSAISVHPTIQEYNPTAGLAQSAMVAIYCTYLTMSAVSMEPDDDRHCNPVLQANGTRKASIVIGALMTLLTIAYTTTRAATQSKTLGRSNSPSNGGYASLNDDEHGLVSTEPSRAEMRAQVLREAVESGALPASALDEDDDDDESDSGKGADDERGSTQYSYTFFHIIFLLATAWTATLLTMSIEPGKDDEDGFTPVGRTYAASWVKILSAWACYGIYIWTVIAPYLLPDRF